MGKWKCLKDVLKLLARSSKGMGPVLLLMALFLFIFSILGMQMLGTSGLGTRPGDDGFVRFDAFFPSFVQCFYVVIGEMDYLLLSVHACSYTCTVVGGSPTSAFQSERNTRLGSSWEFSLWHVTSSQVEFPPVIALPFFSS